MKINLNRIDKWSNWSNFVVEISKLFFFWIFGIVFFQLFRLSLILFFINQVNSNSGWLDFYKTFVMGFKFDATVISYFILFPLLSCLMFAPFGKIEYARYIRKIFQYLFIFSATIICVVTINYFREYNDQFNHFLFVGLYDDKKAIIETIYNHFNPLINFIVIISIIVLCIFIFKIIERKKTFSHYFKKIKKWPYKALYIVAIIFLFIGSIRGSFGSRPAMRKWAYLTKDQLLNKTIINPFRSLNYAISDFKKFNKIDGENPFGKLENYIDKEESIVVSAIISKKSEGSASQIPNHIFLIVMESLDSWPLLLKYSEFNIVPNMLKFSKKGIYFPNFLPASNSTMNSFCSIVTGIPYTGVNISKIGAIGPAYPSSIFTQFKKLGYETNFFYGGFLSWQNIGNFVINQGVDNVYSAADVGGKAKSGVWGVDDDMLFRLVMDSIDNERNSLNIILTTSYHPPYTIDVYEQGFPYRSDDDLPLKSKSQYTGAMSIVALGHLWYSDKAIGDFVAEAELKHPSSIFCFTGDHYGRRFINSYPNLQETSEVPFIIYGNNIAPQINDTPGSHINILPTLIEMIAPADFDYFAFGNSLINGQNNKIGVGYNKIISKNEILYLSAGSDIQTFDLNTLTTSFTKDNEYVTEYKKLHSLAWHYIVRGDSIYAK